SVDLSSQRQDPEPAPVPPASAFDREPPAGDRDWVDGNPVHLGTRRSWIGFYTSGEPREVVARFRDVSGNSLHHHAPAGALGGVVLVDFKGDGGRGRIGELGARRCPEDQNFFSEAVVDREDLRSPIDHYGDPPEG